MPTNALRTIITEIMVTPESTNSRGGGGGLLGGGLGGLGGYGGSGGGRWCESV